MSWRRSQRKCGLSRRFAATRLLGMRVRISLGAIDFCLLWGFVRRTDPASRAVVPIVCFCRWAWSGAAINLYKFTEYVEEVRLNTINVTALIMAPCKPLRKFLWSLEQTHAVYTPSLQVKETSFPDCVIMSQIHPSSNRSEVSRLPSFDLLAQTS